MVCGIMTTYSDANGNPPFSIRAGHVNPVELSQKLASFFAYFSRDASVSFEEFKLLFSNIHCLVSFYCYSFCLCGLRGQFSAFQNKKQDISAIIAEKVQILHKFCSKKGLNGTIRSVIIPSACFMAGFLLDYSLQEPGAAMLRALIFA